VVGAGRRACLAGAPSNSAHLGPCDQVPRPQGQQAAIKCPRRWPPLRRFEQLRAYQQQHGDANVGFRDGDDADLARWAGQPRS
jgi:hypothetical protein